MSSNNKKLFNVLSPNFCSDSGRDAISSERDHIALMTEKVALADALSYPYRVTSDEAEQIAACFPRRHTLPAAQNRDCSHPVLAVLNDYANEDARKQIAEHSSKNPPVRTLSIGDACHSKIGANHNCLLVDSCREAHRITSNARAPTDLLDFATNGTPCAARCINGTHLCNVLAEHAYAIHSVYDMTMEQVYTTFARHGLKSMTVYMYFTTRILAEFPDPYPFFKVDLRKGEKTCFFTMQDESFCYEHSVATWTAWHDTTLIRGEDFCITIEVVRQFGPLRVIKLQRVANELIRSNLTRVIPLPRYFPNMMCVPDIFWSMKCKFLPTQLECRHFLVPENVVLALMAYANRAGDNGYQFHELAAYASGLRRRIQIGTTTFQDPWYCGPEEYNRVIYSLFVLGAIARTDRTKGIKDAFQYLKQHMGEGFFANLGHEISRQVASFFDGIFHNRPNPEIELAGKRLWEYHSLPLRDLYTNTVYRTNFINHYKIPVMPVPVQKYDLNKDVEMDIIHPSTVCLPHKIGTAVDKSKIVELKVNDIPIVVNPPIVDPPTGTPIVDDPIVNPPVVKNDPPVAEPVADPVVVDNIPCQMEGFANPLADLDEEIVEPNTTYSLNRFKLNINTDPDDIDILSQISSDYDFTLLKTMEEMNNKNKNDSKSIFSFSMDEYQSPDEPLPSLIFTNSGHKMAGLLDEPAAGIEKVEQPSPVVVPLMSLVFDEPKNIEKRIKRPSECGYDTGLDLEIRDSRGPLPTKFSGGHCIMSSLYRLVISMGVIDNDTTEALWIQEVYTLLCDDRLHTMYEIEEYIYEGKWEGNDICSSVANQVANKFRLFVSIEEVKPKAKSEFHYVGPVNGHKCRLIHRGNHFMPVIPRGGAVEKFDGILDQFSWLNIKVLDVSAAPGYLTQKLRSRGATVFAGHYKPGSRMTQTLGNRHNENYFEYNHHNQLYEHVKNRKFDVLINDAAREVNSEDIIDEINAKFYKLLNPGGMLLSKSFGNPHELWSLAYQFHEIEMIYVSETCSERYFALRGYKIGLHMGTVRPIDHFHRIYDRKGWNRLITTHTLPHCDNNRFANEYFRDATVRDFKPKDIVNFVPGTSFSVNCVTGFASASKTTNALKQYKNAVMIAPSKTLTRRHQAMGIPSYTPHVFFSHKHKGIKTIIIDEAFQFPVEYVSLLYQCYSDKEIVLLGDVEQTPMVNYISMKTTDLLSCGIKNSNIDVYKIPQDVTESLNRKHGFNIRTHSEVEQGWVICKDAIAKFAKSTINVICFNSDSAKSLRDQGINASTITTYTGSRDHTVVFYIDSASVLSQITNKPQYIYTAVSRATNQIVVAGDTDIITKYYNILGSRLMTYEEISGNYNSHHIKLPSDETIGIVVPSEIACLPPNLPATVAILSNNLAPVNDPEGLVLGNYTANIAEVGCGRLTTPTDAVLATDVSVKGFRFPLNTKLAKHQISNNTLQAIQTLTKRYGKAYKQRLTKTRTKVTYTALMNGLCKAIYGNPHHVRELQRDMLIDESTIRERYGDYMESLQQKINKNPAAAKDLESNYEFEYESLQYFNKQQTKWDPKAGFDTSDKVGQGVAATSKRFNLLLAGYARAMLDRVKELLVKHNRKIVLATHDSEAGLNDSYVEFIREFSGNGKANFSCNDFSEWDSSFRQPFAQVTTQLLKWMGCPDQLASEWALFREEWTMIYRHAFGTTMLDGKEKQFSGNPFTICENSICNMALCFVIFDYKGFLWAFFKGDDSCVRCKSCKITSLGKEILNFTGHGLKLHNSPIGEFAGWFLTEHGFFPDVYRYAGKFLDKVYRDQKHFQEALSSLQERCAAVKNNIQANTGAAMCALYYADVFGSHTTTSQEEVLILFDFLKGSRSVKFSDLMPAIMPLMTF